MPSLLQSICNQRFNDYELIVADCCETGVSCGCLYDIATKFGVDKVLTVVGLTYAACNEGAKAAIGEWLLFLDADLTIPEPDAFCKVMRFVKTHNVDAATVAIKQRNPTFHSALRETIRSISPFLTQFILIKKTVFYEVGGFAPLKLDLDVEFNARVKRKGYSVVNIPDVYVVHERLYRDAFKRFCNAFIVATPPSFPRRVFLPLPEKRKWRRWWEYQNYITPIR